MEENTNALIAALDIPEVDAIAHPDNPQFQIDPTALVAAAKKKDKVLEINNRSLCSRIGSIENCREIIRLCKRQGVRVTVSSDAHFCIEIGKVERSISLLEESNFPAELVINATPGRFEEYLAEREKRLLKSLQTFN
jgi:putative hydrolase